MKGGFDMRKTEHAEIKLVIDGIAFTWDDKKAAINPPQARHKIFGGSSDIP